MKLDQWPTYCTCATDERLTLETSALGTPDSGQFTLSTQFTKPHYLVIPLFSPFPSPSPSPPPHPHKGSTAKVTPFIQMKVNTIAFPHSKASRLGILYPHNSPNFFSAFPEITIPWTGIQTESTGREEKLYYWSCKTPSLTLTNLVSHQILHLFQIVWSRMDILFGLVLLEDPC